MNTACTHFNAADGPIHKAGFDTLKIGEETAAGDTRDLFTNTASLFCKTAARNRSADERFSIAECTVIHRAVLYPGLQGWQVVFSDIYCRLIIESFVGEVFPPVVATLRMPQIGELNCSVARKFLRRNVCEN